MSLARLMVFYLIALHLLFIGGCLCESECSTLIPVPDFDDVGPVTLLDGANERYIPPVEVTTAKPIATPAPSHEPAAFTGAVVHVSDGCTPCHWLLTDLQMLRDQHGWTLAEASENRPANWVIEHNTPGVDGFPQIDFYRNGTLDASHSGYATSPNFGDRRDTLVAMVATHNRLKAHGVVPATSDVPQPPN